MVEELRRDVRQARALQIGRSGSADSWHDRAMDAWKVVAIVGYAVFFYFLFRHEQFMNLVRWLARLVH